MVKAEGVMEGGEGERKAKTARRAIDTAGCGSDVGRQCVWGGGWRGDEGMLRASVHAGRLSDVRVGGS